MTSIAPVPPIDEALKALASGSGAAAQPAVAPELRQQFESLMRPQVDVAPEPTGPNALAAVIQTQQSDIDKVEAGAQKFLDDAPHMSSMEITTSGMALSHSLAMVNMKMQVATSLTQGSNKSLQTLLKNQ
jgi:type III secretion system HrpB2-like protein